LPEKLRELTTYKKNALTINSPKKVSKLSIPTIMVPSPTMKSRLDLKTSPNPNITPSPRKSGNGSRRPERELTPRLQVKLTKKNSIDSPTPSSDISISATLPEKLRLKNE
jgi:hypothetical protein